MRPNRVSIRTGYPRPELRREDDPVWWDAHHAAINQRVADAAARRPENWPHGRQLALLMIQRSTWALECIAGMKGVRPTEKDFAWLRTNNLAERPLMQRFHALTDDGRRIAREVCFAVAKRLGLHHVTYSLDRWTEHVARCTCGWHQSLSRRMNVNARGYLEERARRHLLDPEAWKHSKARETAIIEQHFPTKPLASENPDAIDDPAMQVYGEWPEIDTPCDSPNAPTGQCEFNAITDPDHCIWCKRRT